jgi:hypothetical protein
MAFDPSIFNQANRPSVQLENPMDVAMKGLAMKGQIQQQAIQQQGIQDAQDFRNQYGMSPGMAKNVKDLQTAGYQAQHAKALATNEQIKAQDWLAGQQTKVFESSLDMLNQHPEAGPQIHAATMQQLAQNAQQVGIDPSSIQRQDPTSFAAPNHPTESDPSAAPTWDVEAQKQWLQDSIKRITPEAIAQKRQELAIAQQRADAEKAQKIMPTATGFARYNPDTGKLEDVSNGMKPPRPSNTNVYVTPPGIQKGLTGQDLLESLKPADKGVVNAILDGRQAAPSAFAQKTPYWQEKMEIVHAIDPNWSEQRAQIRKAFTTGPDGKNIGALNTATVHLDAYLEAAQAMENGQFTPGNAIYNKISTILGQPAPTSFEAIKNAVAGEQAAALKGNATDIEIHNIAQTMKNSNSPEQFLDSGKAALGIMRQKLQTYQERYSQQNPGDTYYSPVLPSAKTVFDKYGVEAGVPAGAAFSGTKPLPQSMMGGLPPKVASDYLAGKKIKGPDGTIYQKGQ